jgi:hypothetical protein
MDSMKGWKLNLTVVTFIVFSIMVWHLKYLPPHKFIWFLHSGKHILHLWYTYKIWMKLYNILWSKIAKVLIHVSNWGGIRVWFEQMSWLRQVELLNWSLYYADEKNMGSSYWCQPNKTFFFELWSHSLVPGLFRNFRPYLPIRIFNVANSMTHHCCFYSFNSLARH